jgi:hypothetical protein
MAISELDEISLETYLAPGSERESDKCGAIQVVSPIAATALAGGNLLGELNRVASR